MDYLKEWKLAKTNFEKATDRKKPSKTFLGVRQSTGIEPICKTLNGAIASGDGKKAMSAATALQKAVKEYETTLGKAAAGADKNLLTEVKVLHGELLLLQKTAVTEATELAAWTKIAGDVLKSPFLTRPELGKFLADKAGGTLVATGAASNDLKGAQAEIRSNAVAFKAGLAAVGKVKPAEANKKQFINALRDAQDHLSIIGGMGHNLGEWSRMQREAATDSEAQKKLGGSAVWKAFNSLNEALSAENERLGVLEQDFERHVLHTR